MNPRIERLYQIAHAPSRTILGLMSGTSLDGLDLALVRFTGFGLDTSYEILHYDTRPIQQILRSRFVRFLPKKTFISPPFPRLTPKLDVYTRPLF